MILKSLGDKRIKIYALCTLCLTMLACVIRTFCLAFFYDTLGEDVGYYSDSALPIVFYVVCVVAVLLFASIALVLKQDAPCSDGREENIFLRIVSAVVAIELIAFFVLSLISADFIVSGIVFDLLIKLSLLMSIAYFAMNAFGADSNRTLQTLFGFGIVIWAVCVLAITYFDIFIPLNSPDKIILHLALLSLMAFFVSEFRCFVVGIKKRLYIFSLCCAVFFSGVASIPSLIKWFALGMGDYNYLDYDPVILGLFVYASIRLVSFAFSIDRREESVSEPSAKTESEI